MAKFLNTRKISSEIEDLIKVAGDTLYLISPYLRLSIDFRELLNSRNNQKKETTIIFGKQELNPEEMKFLQSLRYVILKYHQNLHAKCYINDGKMIITSMNLYEYSMSHNKEMGVLFDNADPNDAKIYDEALKDIKFIEENSKEFDFRPVSLTSQAEKSKISAQPSKEFIPKTKSSTATMGSCIRCKKSIQLNPLIPYCHDCFNVWKGYGDEEYPEKYCHICGKLNKSSKIKPACISCYKEKVDTLKFPLY